MLNTGNKGTVVNRNAAGIPKFAAIASKYQAAATPAVDPEKKKEGERSPALVPDEKHAEAAKSMISAVKASVDRNITGKRKHPAFKGDRIPRTYKIPIEIDGKMDSVYEKEGVEKQALVIKALKMYLDKTYPEIK
jgi:hypothetical protein